MARCLFVVICLLVGLSSTLVGANDAIVGKRVALVIGNGNYERSPDLSNASADAEAVGVRLQQVGFTLVGGRVHQDLRRKDMLRLIRDFGDAIGRGGTALFYFAGHGVGDSDANNWLIPVDDGDIQIQEDVRYYSIDVDAVLRQLENRIKDVNILILDACRDNPLPNRARSASNTQGLARMDAPPGSFITYAAAPGQVALDGDGRHSLFTQALLDRLGKPGQRIEDLMSNVTNAVKAGSSGKQVPWQKSSLEQTFYFNPLTRASGQNPTPPPGPGTPNPGSEDMSLWVSVEKRGKIADYQAYLQIYPNGRFAVLARSSIARLKKTQGDKPGAGPASAPVVDKNTIFWESIRNSKDPADYQAYLEAYPGGGFATLARNRLAALQRAAAERKQRKGAHRRRNELMESERKNPWGFWGTVTPQDTALLVSGTRPGNWPVFTLGNEDYQKEVSRLHFAALRGHDEIARALLERGPDVNVRKGDQWTPLHLAAGEGHEQVARLLLEQGADIHARTNKGKTALGIAKQKGHTKLVKLLRAKLRQAGRR